MSQLARLQPEDGCINLYLLPETAYDNIEGVVNNKEYNPVEICLNM